MPSRPLLLLLGGHIVTMAQEQPTATALAVDRLAGRIVAVGDDAEIRALAGPLTETVHLGGRTVLPGLIDAHTHLMHYAQARLDVDLRSARSEEEAVARVSQRAALLPEGTWIRGRSWNASNWPGHALPTAASLDAAVPHHPVALVSYDHHTLWVNAEALRRAGIDAQTPQPAGGRIERDGSGAPTGLLFEAGATQLVDAVMSSPDDALLRAELRHIFAELRARGITGVHNIEDARSVRLLQELHAAGELTSRVLLYIPRRNMQDALRLGLGAGFGDDRLRVGGVKVFMDGALGSRTAALLDPYEGQPENRGLLTTSEEEVADLMRLSAEGGLGLAIHAIGDRAVRTALDGIEAWQRTATGWLALISPRRIRLEHVQLAAPEDLARMARLGVVASVQPFHAVADRTAAEASWGARHRGAYAYQTMRREGIALALGSDVPVDTCDPLRILYAAIARRNDAFPELGAWLPEQALTVPEALWAYTAGAAYAGGQEAHQGRLVPGALADLVVFEEDPFTVPVDQFPALPVAATFVGGDLVHGTLS